MNDQNENLTDISTSWTLLFQSHEGPAEEVKEARRFLLDRYSKPVYRYLLASVKNPDAANDLFQEFALRFVRGDFRRADPDRGRFRHYLKRALHHLIVDHHRRQQRQPAPLPLQELPATTEKPPIDETEQAFSLSWRAELLNRTWDGLEKFEKQTGKLYFTILHRRTENRQLTSDQMAAQLTGELKKEITATWVRKQVYHAREKFAELLLQEVLGTLEISTRDHLEEELLELGVLEYCASALDKFFPDGKNSENES